MSGAVVSGLSCYDYCVEAFVSGVVVSGAVMSGAVVLWLLCRGVRVRGCGVGGCRVAIDCVECHDVGACGVGGCCEGKSYGKSTLGGILWRKERMLLRNHRTV